MWRNVLLSVHAVFLLFAIVTAMESHLYVRYIPSSADEAQRKVTTPTCRLQQAFSPELRFNSGRIRTLERVFRYLDALYAHQLDPVPDNTTDSTANCNRSVAFTTTFYGSGFFSHFQSYAKTMMFGLHHMNFSAPLVPQGDILGYSTTKHCDFAHRSFYCYFQHLSPCQAIWASSMVPLSPSVYRYQAFDSAMIPTEFRRDGEAFWWGALQYYVFMHMHGGIINDYIKNDAFRETPYFVKFDSFPRIARTAASRGAVARNDRRASGRRALTAVGPGINLPLPNGNNPHVVGPSGAGARAQQPISVQPHRFTRRPPAPHHRVGTHPTSTTAPTKEQRLAALQRASQAVPPAAVDNNIHLHPKAHHFQRLIPNITRTRPLNVGQEGNLNNVQMVPVAVMKPKETRVWSARGGRSSSSSTAASESPRQPATSKISRRSVATLAAPWLPRIGVHVRSTNVDHEEPAQIMLSADNAAFRTHSVTLTDVDEHIRNSTLCQLRFTLQRPLDEYTQCFAAVDLFAFPEVGNATRGEAVTAAEAATVEVANTYEQWRVFHLLRMAAAGKANLLYRRDVSKYGRFVMAAGRSVQTWLTNGDVLKRSPVTREVFDLYHSGMFVPLATVRQMLQIYQRACRYGNETTSPLEAGDANDTCRFTADDVAFVQQATAGAAGGWAVPVDVLLVSDNASLLTAVESRYHWLTFPPGVSQDILHDKRARHKYAHAGSALRQSSAKSHYSTMPVQASLEVLRDVYYLTHACTVLIGSASSQVFRAAVSMSGAIGRVAEVRWLDSPADQGTWKRRADQIAMPFPEIPSAHHDEAPPPA